MVDESRVVSAEPFVGVTVSTTNLRSRMSSLACARGSDFLWALLFSASCIKVSSWEERPFGTSCLQAHLSHAVVSVDSQCLQVTLADVHEAQLGSPIQPLSSCQSSKEKVLGDTVVLHKGDMAQSVQVPLQGAYGGDPCHLRQCFVGYFVSPGDAQDVPQAVHVEGVESSFLF